MPRLSISRSYIERLHAPCGPIDKTCENSRDIERFMTVTARPSADTTSTRPWKKADRQRDLDARDHTEISISRSYIECSHAPRGLIDETDPQSARKGPPHDRYGATFCTSPRNHPDLNAISTREIERRLSICRSDIDLLDPMCGFINETFTITARY